MQGSSSTSGAATSRNVSNAAPATAGRLFYVAGAADAGIDKLIGYARAHVNGGHTVVFAHRYSTRTTGGGGETDVVLSEAEFALRKRRGLFVMDWDTSGLRYGVGTEINYWLALGLSVVVRGSPVSLEQVLKAYPDMAVIWVIGEPDAVTTPQARRPDVAPPRATCPLGPDRAVGFRMVHIINTGSLLLRVKSWCRC